MVALQNTHVGGDEVDACVGRRRDAVIESVGPLREILRAEEAACRHHRDADDGQECDHGKA